MTFTIYNNTVLHYTTTPSSSMKIKNILILTVLFCCTTAYVFAQKKMEKQTKTSTRQNHEAAANQTLQGSPKVIHSLVVGSLSDYRRITDHIPQLVTRPTVGAIVSSCGDLSCIQLVVISLFQPVVGVVQPQVNCCFILPPKSQ